MEISDGSIADAELSQAQENNELAACMNGLDNELEEKEDEEDDQLDLSDRVSTQSRPAFQALERCCATPPPCCTTSSS